MSCVQNCSKLPTISNYNMIRCIKIDMSNGEKYTVKVDDLVGIQFVKDDKRILVRRGRVKDIVLVNTRALSTPNDNISRIILDCSEQFSIKVIEIKLKDIIKIGGIDDEFNDYSNRITELEPNFIDGNRIPVRENGMYTEEEWEDKKTKPDTEGVVEANSQGEFSDLSEPSKKIAVRGFPVMK